MKTLLFFLCSITCLHIYSQNDTLSLGNGFKTKLPKVFKEDYIQSWHLPNGTVQNTIIANKSIELLALNNKPTWAFIQHYRSSKFVDSDTTFFDGITLQPLAYRTNIASQGYKETVSFNKELINVVIQYKDSTKEKSYPASGGYIQATMREYLVSALPLKKGYSTVFRIINAGLNYAEMSTRITVVDKEDIPLTRNSKIACWKVEMITGTSKSTHWFTVEDQTYLKMEWGTPEKGLYKKQRIAVQ